MRMMDIDKYIEQSKDKQNISIGGSICYDFDDYVLLRYSCPLNYLEDNNHTRNNEELVFQGINEKRNRGVNVPRHIAFKRRIEGNNEVCYVLQEKSKGINLASISRYGATFDEVINSMDYLYNIPFNHYIKLVKDGLDLYEMGYEPQARNLFYDNETGFWYIDLVDYDKNNSFNYNDIFKIFKAIKYRIPKIIELSSSLKYKTYLTKSKKNKIDNMTNLIKVKNLLAIELVIPSFKKYEKFYLFNEDISFKRFLVEKKIVNNNLFLMDDKDFELFNELYELIIENILYRILNDNLLFWQVEYSEIRKNSDLFNLRDIWQYHKDNKINRYEYDNESDYLCDVYEDYDNKMMMDIIERLSNINNNDIIDNFLNDYKNWYKSMNGHLLMLKD